MKFYSLFGLLLACFQFFQFSKGEIFWIEARVPLEGERPPPGSPWPVPQRWRQSPKTLVLDPPSFYFSSNAHNCDIIQAAILRYRDLTFFGHNRSVISLLSDNVKVLNRVSLFIEDSSECSYPKFDDNEAYEIEISHNDPESATIRSKSVWGALRGLETFSQLVYQDPMNGYFLINDTIIMDWPEYKYRGLLLDTSRHYIPMRILLANLDAMAYAKFNVFHWHLVDDQSFPFESKRFPTLTQRGAYSPNHVYTQKDVKFLIDYARMRGIRVIPEIDSPGHTKSYEKAFPNLLTPCYGEGADKPYTPKYPDHSEADMLNPLRNQSYYVMKELFKELKNLFPDEYLHLGMDEVYYACWKSNPEIANFMAENGFTDVSQVEQYYVRKTLATIQDLNYKYIMWQDPVDNGVQLPPSSIVQVWKETSLDSTMKSWVDYIKPIAQQGYKIILSSCWYLNYIKYPYPGQDWELFYKCDPKSFSQNRTEQDLVVGGEACLWSEFADGTNLLSRVWPRALATAERLWTNPDVNDVDSARFRLDQHRCRMLRRGIPAAPILNGYCGDYEWGMGPVGNVAAGERIKLGKI